MVVGHADAVDAADVVDFPEAGAGLLIGPGTRFREAYNVRRVNGVRMADYHNYTVDTLSADQMEEYPDLWARDAVRLVSEIKLDSVQVRLL